MPQRHNLAKKDQPIQIIVVKCPICLRHEKETTQAHKQTLVMKYFSKYATIN